VSVALRPFNVLSLFAGYGGLDLGVRLAVPGARTVCYVEREAYAAACLVARMEEEALEAAPIWDDVCSFDGRRWRGVVDCIAGGFPCQDISTAGTRAGIIDGERSGLWREFARIIREVEPEYVFVENVGALIVRGLDVVLGDLAALGFDAEWGCVQASDVGAPHRRERVFVLAHHQCWGRRAGERDDDARGGQPDAVGGVEALEHFALDGRGEGRAERAGRELESAPVLAGGGRELADADGDGCRWQGLHVSERGPRCAVRNADGTGEARTVDDSDCARLERRHGGRVARAYQFATWPPGPADAAGWAAYLTLHPECAPARVVARVRRGADGPPDGLDPPGLCLCNRNDRLRLLGNGVVPQQAALAWRMLRRRLDG